MAPSDLNIGPIGPVSSLPATRPITRVTPVAPQPATEPDASPLTRSGLNVHELFNAPDQVVVRSRTPAVALDLGLEHARGSMVRNQPAEALATLDEVWSGARHTETGWYLRGGSLALLGLASEASRIATEALKAKPESSANHFLLSLAKLTMGDLPAAQLALANAEAHSEPEALFVIQRALIEAQRGNVTDAEELLRHAAGHWPDHPALLYGREMMRAVLRNNSRERQRTPARLMHTPVNEPAVQTPSGPRTPVSSSTLSTETAHGETEIRTHARDFASDAFHEFGALLSSGSPRQALGEARALLGSLSAGGTLANAMPAARAHAARAVIGAVIEALNGNARSDAVGWDAESIDGQWQRAQHDASMNAHDELSSNVSLHQATRALVVALRDGNVQAAEGQLRRVRGSLGESTFGLLRALLTANRVSDGEPIDSSQTQTAPTAFEAGSAPVQDGFAGHTLLAPLRLGLALLPETELSDQRVRMLSESNAAVTYASAMARVSFGDESRNVLRPLGSTGTLIAAAGVFALAVLAFLEGASAHRSHADRDGRVVGAPSGYSWR